VGLPVRIDVGIGLMKKFAPYLIALAALILGIILLATHRASVPGSVERQQHPFGLPPTGDASGTPVSPSEKQDSSSRRLVVHVQTPEGRPIAGVQLFCNFMGSPSRGAESTPGSGGEILSIPKGLGFRGNPVTGPEGTASFEIVLPPGAVYLNAPIDILTDYPDAVVKRENSRTIPAVRPGETREVTLQLELGTRVRGILRGIDPEDYDDFYVSLEVKPKTGVIPIDEDSKVGKKHWVTLPKVRPGGTFVSDPVPSIPLLLTVNHLSGKFALVHMEIQPPFDQQVEVPLERNLDYQELATLNISIPNPPPAKDFPHTLILFAEEAKRVLNRGSMITKDPVREKVSPGRYQAFVFAEKESLWGHTSLEANVKSVTNVAVTLEPAAIVPLRVRDRATGASPVIPAANFTLAYKIEGNYYELFNPWQVNLLEKIAGTGQIELQNLPPGEIRLTFQVQGKNGYRKWTQDMISVAGRNPPIEMLLERAN